MGLLWLFRQGDSGDNQDSDLTGFLPFFFAVPSGLTKSFGNSIISRRHTADVNPGEKFVNILVLGSGAREHSMVHSLSKSPSVHRIVACPGNVGMADISLCKRLPFKDNADLIRHCRDKIDLAVVGSSKFVEDGTVDALVLAGIPVIGPAEDAGKLKPARRFLLSSLPGTKFLPHLRQLSSMKKRLMQPSVPMTRFASPSATGFRMVPGFASVKMPGRHKLPPKSC